jgi:hypothetical protein
MRQEFAGVPHSCGRQNRWPLVGSAVFLALGFGGARADPALNLPAPPSWGSEPAAADEPLAPVGIFGANLPGAGHAVFTYSASYLRTDGNMIGTSSVSPNYIISHIYSGKTPVAGNHLLRVVPISGESFGQYFTINYGVTSDFAVVATGGYLYKNKELLTYKGQQGTTPLGTSQPSTQGISDTTIAGIGRIYKDDINRVLVSFGLGLPTGRYNNTWTPLSPSGTYTTKVAVYGMQEGSGSVAAIPGITYKGFHGLWSWGLSYRAWLPFGNNPDGWRFGDLSAVTGWAGYSWLPGFTTTTRLGWVTQDHIHGSSRAILGYAEGNDPQFYGGTWVDLNFGVSLSGRYFNLPKLTIQAEVGVPLYQRLNGPQAAASWAGVLRLQYKL